MKVRDVIAKLQTLDPEAEVTATDCAYCQGEESPVLKFEEYTSELDGAPIVYITGKDRY